MSLGIEEGDLIDWIAGHTPKKWEPERESSVERSISAGDADLKQIQIK